MLKKIQDKIINHFVHNIIINNRTKLMMYLRSIQEYDININYFM